MKIFELQMYAKSASAERQVINSIKKTGKFTLCTFSLQTI